MNDDDVISKCTSIPTNVCVLYFSFSCWLLYNMISGTSCMNNGYGAHLKVKIGKKSI